MTAEEIRSSPQHDDDPSTPHSPLPKPKCHRFLSRAARQLFRREAYPILIHYHGRSPWRGATTLDADTPNGGGVDSRGRKRKRLPLVEDPNDDLTDDEWYALLSYAIDHSSTSRRDIDGDATATTCPLHPRHDMLLSQDRKTYLIHRRYRTGAAASKFGGLSLPLSGRATRSALWAEERQFYGTNLGTRHLQEDIRDNAHDNSLAQEEESTPKLICPAEDVCEALGGISVCAEIMYQMSPYYGPGTLLGKEYISPASESSFASSIHSLIERWYHSRDNDEEDELFGKIEVERSYELEEVKKNSKHDNYKPKKMRQADFHKLTSEMRHRIVWRNQLLLKAVQHRHLNMQQFIEAESLLHDESLHSIDNGGNDYIEGKQPSTLSSCNEEDMTNKFQLCHRMMAHCFGDDTSQNEHTLTKDLISHICEPLHCHHRLHRMAGHSPRHIVHWNDEWEEHHSFSLGVFGWMMVSAIGTFYIVIFVFGFGGEGSLLPRYWRKEKNKVT